MAHFFGHVARIGTCCSWSRTTYPSFSDVLPRSVRVQAFVTPQRSSKLPTPYQSVSGYVGFALKWLKSFCLTLSDGYLPYFKPLRSRSTRSAFVESRKVFPARGGGCSMFRIWLLETYVPQE